MAVLQGANVAGPCWWHSQLLRSQYFNCSTAAVPLQQPTASGRLHDSMFTRLVAVQIIPFEIRHPLRVT